MPITHGAVRRASGAGPGWASFQTTGCLGHTEREIGGKKIREEIERGEIKDKKKEGKKMEKEEARREKEEGKWRTKNLKMGKGYEKE